MTFQVSGGEQTVLAYDSYPRPNTTGASKPQQQQHQQQQQQHPIPQEMPQGPIMSQPNMGPPGPGGMQQGPPNQGFNVPPNLNLPPDLANILSQLQTSQANNGDPVMAQVQQILNNIMVCELVTD